MRRAIKNVNFALIALACVSKSAAGNAESARYIKILPSGTSDGSLPALWISTRDIKASHAFEFHDTVSIPIYSRIERFIKGEICSVSQNVANREIGPPATIALSETLSNGNVVTSCQIQRPQVDYLINCIGKIYEDRGFHSRGIEIWRLFLRARGDSNFEAQQRRQ